VLNEENRGPGNVVRRGRGGAEPVSLLVALLVLLAACKSGPTTPTAPPSGSPSPTPPEGDIALSAPYADAAEFKYVFPGYSEGAASGAPWGFQHQGLDYILARNGARVLAPAGGSVEQVALYQNPNSHGQWQVNLRVRFSARFSYDIYFEPRAHSESAVADQRAAILVSDGQRINKGDLLGGILDLSHGDRSAGEPGIHFDLLKDDQNVCPQPYFDPAALAGTLTLLRAKFPGAKLCYP
jgi:murein DD-endopeptidase MepM/ murein hydrolase activator NlpD